MLCVLAVSMAGGVRAYEGQTAISTATLKSESYFADTTVIYNPSNQWIESTGLDGTDWTVNITFPDFAWNNTACNATSAIVLNFCTVKPNATGLLNQTGQSLLQVFLQPTGVASSQFSYYNATQYTASDAFAWDNDTISIYVNGTAIVMERFANGVGSHNDTFTLAAGTTVSPSYISYYHAHGELSPVEDGDVVFTFGWLTIGEMTDLMLYSVLGIVVTMCVLTMFLGILKKTVKA
jgi:hypothetical protein